jgi:selenide,water dikinase
MAAAIESMTTLNAGAMQAALATDGGVHAATDVTGFGLVGHLHAMLRASGVAGRLTAPTVPVFPRVLALISSGAVPGGTERNVAAAVEYVRWGDGVPADVRTALCDAQTSGGLLLAVAPSHLKNLLVQLREAATPATAVIGGVTDGEPGEIEVSSVPA